MQWKILHGIYPTRRSLFKMNIVNSNTCEYCHVVDDIEHYFVHCKEIIPVWKNVQTDINFIAGKNIRLTEQIIIIGLKNHECLEASTTSQINFSLLLGKRTIVKYKSGNKTNLTILYEQEKRYRDISCN